MKVTEARVRAQVERTLKQALSDEHWKHFRDATMWVDWVLRGEEEVSWLVEMIRNFLEKFGTAPEPSTKTRKSIRQAHSADAPFWGLTRQDALCTAVAALAERDAAMRAFRSEVLGNQLLTYTDTRREFVDVWLTCQVERERPLQEADTSAWPLLSCIRVLGARAEPQPVKPGGVLDQLRQLAERLADQYHWEPAAAAAFVLTDAQPNVATLRVTVRPNHHLSALSRVVIEVDPYRAPDEVAAAYQQVRNGLMRSRPHDRQTRPRTRKMSEKHLGLGTFAAMRPPREPLDDQMADWNAMVPDPKWRYPKAQKTNFVRDRKSAFTRLVQPDYQLPTQEETISYDDFPFQRDQDDKHDKHNKDTNDLADDDGDESDDT